MANTYSYWSDSIFIGWNYDTIESVLSGYADMIKNRQTFIPVDRVYPLAQNLYTKLIEPLYNSANIKLNLGGDNERSKLKMSDKPTGVFDFSLASAGLFRVHEFYSEDLAFDAPDRFADYNVPSGVVPNYFVKKIVVDGESNFFFHDEESNKDYNLMLRQKGLTEILKTNPSLPTIIRNGMLTPLKATKGVKFSSTTKKPYLVYEKQGGKIQYVELYSVYYYADMMNDFQYMVRHIPAMMLLEYLEKQGVMCKMYITRMISQSPIKTYQRPSKRDNVEPKPNITINNITYKSPMYPLVKDIALNPDRGVFVVQPMCVKEYGQEVNKALALSLGTNTLYFIYDELYAKSKKLETTSRNEYSLGLFQFSESEYQEAFERFRQKQAIYSAQGIWESKEVTRDGMIYFNDVVLNKNFNNEIKSLTSVINFSSKKKFNYKLSEDNKSVCEYNSTTQRWFNLWMKISADTIKHKYDIFNSKNLLKTYKLVFADLENHIEEMNKISKDEKDRNLRNFIDSWAIRITNKYYLDRPKQYCLNRIEEMTFYATGGAFETPKEEIEEREENARFLREELKKM